MPKVNLDLEHSALINRLTVVVIDLAVSMGINSQLRLVLRGRCVLLKLGGRLRIVFLLWWITAKLKICCCLITDRHQ